MSVLQGRRRALRLTWIMAVLLGSFAAGTGPAGPASAAPGPGSPLASGSHLWEPAGLRPGAWLPPPSADVVPGPGSGSKWQVQPTPNPVLLRNGALLADSCTGPTACTAVGSAINGSGVLVTLAQRRSGRSGVIQATPNPAGAVWSSLFGVSCSSARACVAVGYYYHDTTGQARPLAERWNGRNWAVQATPRPAGALATGFFAVSCTSPGACTAAGEYVTSAGQARPLAERWNGRNWAIQATPRPAGALASAFFAVSCASSRACTAVGAYADSSRRTVTLAQAWNGTRWRVQSTPNPAGVGSEFFGLSCISPRACTAVGSYFPPTADDSRSLAQSWNGTRWTIQSTPSPAGAFGSELLAVSCSSLVACTSVGDYVDRSTNTVTLALAWNGSRWRVQATPATPKPASIFANGLGGVSCASPRACTAVGSYLGFNTVGYRSVVLTWNGARWAALASPDDIGAATSDLAAVSCAAPDACLAVGTYDKTPSRVTSLAETWNGTRWNIQPVPSPARAAGSWLYAVSCTSARACVTVGYYLDATGRPRPLAEARNGTRWKIQPVPSPAGADGTYLDAVSCTSSSACTATGFYNIPSGQGLALAERWNGRTWRIQRTHAPASSQVSLGGVSCTSARACVAVGSYLDATNRARPVAEGWNGARWAIQPVPSTDGASDSELAAVSCTSPRACTATGTLGDRTLAYRWDGKTWTVQVTPTPRFATSSGSSVSLDGVSCVSATACIAIGDYALDGQPTAFAAAWNGTSWSLQATTAPAGAIASTLSAVSCNPRQCTAVGNYTALSGAEVTLAITLHGFEDLG